MIKSATLHHSIWWLGTYRQRTMATTIRNMSEKNDPKTILTATEIFSPFRGIIVGGLLSAVKYQNISNLQGKYRKIRTLDS